MANISKIAAKITANSSQFDTTVEKVKRNFTKMVDNFKSPKLASAKPFNGLADALRFLETKVKEPKALEQIKAALKDLQSGDRPKALEKVKAALQELEKHKIKLFGIDKVVAAMNKAQHSLNDAARGGPLNKINDSYKRVSESATGTRKAVGAVLGIFATYIGLRHASEYLHDVADQMVQLLHTAEKLGDSTQHVAEFQHAIRLVGRDVDGATEALEHFAKLQAKAQTGDSTALFAFRGMDQQRLLKQTPTESLRDAVESLRHIRSETERAARAYQLFGDRASEIIPLIEGGSKGMRDAADKARRLGIAMTDLDVEKFKAGQIAINELNLTFRALWIQIARHVVPIILAVVQLIKEMIPANADLGATAKFLGKAFAYIFTTAYNAFQGLRVGMIAFKAGILTIAVAIEKAIKFALEGIAQLEQLRNPAGAIILKVQAASMQGSINELQGQIAQAKKDVEGIKFIDFGKTEQFISGILARIGGRVTALQTATKKAAEAGFKFGESFKHGLDVFNEVRSPMQQFIDKFKELNHLQKNSAIDMMTYGRAINNAANEFERMIGLGNVALPTIARRDTGEGISAYNRSRNEHEQKNAETAQQRLERLQRTGIDIQRNIEKYTKEMADAAIKTKIVEMR